jgi:hypothetical protein
VEDGSHSCNSGRRQGAEQTHEEEPEHGGVLRRVAAAGLRGKDREEQELADRDEQG